jgi:hypothetical protein
MLRNTLLSQGDTWRIVAEDLFRGCYNPFEKEKINQHDQLLRKEN